MRVQQLHGAFSPHVPIKYITLHGGPGDGMTVPTQWPDITMLEQELDVLGGENRYHEYDDEGHYKHMRIVRFRKTPNGVEKI